MHGRSHSRGLLAPPYPIVDSRNIVSKFMMVTKCIDKTIHKLTYIAPSEMIKRKCDQRCVEKLVPVGVSECTVDKSGSTLMQYNNRIRVYGSYSKSGVMPRGILSACVANAGEVLIAMFPL